MTIESALQTGIASGLAADGNLSAYTIAVYPHTAPEKAVYPFVTYEQLGTSVDKASGVSASSLQLTRATFDIQVHAESVQTRALIQTAIKTLLHGFRGELGTENLDIRESFIDSISAFSERDLTGSDAEIYRASITLNLFYNWS